MSGHALPLRQQVCDMEELLTHTHVIMASHHMAAWKKQLAITSQLNWKCIAICTHPDLFLGKLFDLQSW